MNYGLGIQFQLRLLTLRTQMLLTHALSNAGRGPFLSIAMDWNRSSAEGDSGD